MGNKNLKHFVRHADQRPFKVEINEQKVLFLYDAGAQNSFLNSNLFKQLNLTEKNPSYKSSELSGLVGKAERFDIVSSGVDITILNRDLSFRYLICPFPRQTAILGIDFIHRYFLSCCVFNKTFEFKSFNPFDY